MTKSGAVRWILFHGARVVVDGRPLGLGSAFDITERRDAEDAIRSLAYFDTLTGLPNRRLLMERLGQVMHVGARRGDHGALLILDVDQFKSINDTEGHDAGDSLLIEAARRISACVRPDDTVARLGGDEYVVVLVELGEHAEAAAMNAEAVAEKIRHELARPYRLGSREAEYGRSASIGVTLFRGLERSAEALLKEADIALYQAKDAGRNAVRLFKQPGTHASPSAER